MSLLVWFEETRPRFLLLSLVLTLLGGALSSFLGSFTWGDTLLAGAGILLLHMAVNVLNDWEDYRSGLDLATNRTPFSGGSGVLPSGRMSPGKALALATAAFACAVAVGLYFLFQVGLPLLPLLLFGAVAVLFYTKGFLKVGWGVPEVVAGLGLGSLPVLGVCVVNLGAYDARALFASVPSGLLVFNLLLLNEFPDAEADASVGRKTLPVQAGLRLSAFVYTAAEAAVYLWIGLGLAAGLLPPWTGLAFLTLPAAVFAVRGAWRWRESGGEVKALAANVATVLATQALLAVGLLLS